MDVEALAGRESSGGANHPDRQAVRLGRPRRHDEQKDERRLEGQQRYDDRDWAGHRSLLIQRLLRRSVHLPVVYFNCG
jgi:hypothetical protein